MAGHRFRGEGEIHHLRFSDNAAGVLMAFYFSDPKRAWRRKRIPFFRGRSRGRSHFPIFKRSFWEPERRGALARVPLSLSPHRHDPAQIRRAARPSSNLAPWFEPATGPQSRPSAVFEVIP